MADKTVIGDDHRRKISESLKRKYAEDPTYRQRASQNASKGASAGHAKRRAERDELERLRQENAELRAEVERLRDGR